MAQSISLCRAQRARRRSAVRSAGRGCLLPAVHEPASIWKRAHEQRKCVARGPKQRCRGVQVSRGTAWAVIRRQGKRGGLPTKPKLFAQAAKGTDGPGRPREIGPRKCALARRISSGRSRVALSATALSFAQPAGTASTIAGAGRRACWATTTSSPWRGTSPPALGLARERGR
eukprot:3589320-Alexandrium_andersonii.AAC.1